MDSIGGLTVKQERLFDAVFHAIFKEEFPRYRGDVSGILYSGKQAISGGGDREFKRLVRLFFSENNIRWLRYEVHLDYWGGPEPDPYGEEDDEGTGPDYGEMAELLTHRIIMAYTNAEKRQKYEQEADDSTLWRLRVIEDGRAYPECIEESKTAKHHTDPYWRNKKLPCARLLCRCTISRSFKA